MINANITPQLRCAARLAGETIEDFLCMPGSATAHWLRQADQVAAAATLEPGTPVRGYTYLQGREVQGVYLKRFGSGYDAALIRTDTGRRVIHIDSMTALEPDA